MLEIKKLKKYFGGIKAVNNSSFIISKNKITALIGPNGAGKSTIFNLISSFEKEDSGKIYFNNKDITNYSSLDVAKLGISRVFQKDNLFGNLTVRENLEIAIEEDNIKFWKSFFSSSKTSKSKTIEINDILKLFEITHIQNHLCSDLSFGQKRLVELARAILKKHKLLILDEPVAGVHPNIRNKIMTILKYLKKQGETILLIEHDMYFTFNVCDYIVVMDEGKIIANGKPKDIKNNKKVLDAYLGN